MKRIFLIAVIGFASLLTCRAQSGLQIDSLFNGFLVPKSQLTESIVSGKKLKAYNLDYFRSIRFQASAQEEEKVISWVVSDSRRASDKEMDSDKGRLVYALLRFPGDGKKNRYVGYQIKKIEGKDFVTVVYLAGDATAEDLRVIFKQR